MKKRGLTTLEISIVLLLWAVLSFADVFESVTVHPWGANLKHSPDTIQVTPADSVDITDTLSYMGNAVASEYFSINPGLKTLRKSLNLSDLYLRLILEIRSQDTTGTDNNIRWVLFGRDSTRSGWGALGDTQRVTPNGTSFVKDTLAGFIKRDSIQYLPALFRIDFIDDSARTEYRFNTASYLNATYRTVE
jgi:hypothetical protein